MEHILSLSYGKDSMASIGAIEKLGWPLNRIVTSDIWATDDIPADHPLMVEFKEYADSEIQKRWGIRVEHVRHKSTAFEKMYSIRKSGNRAGQIIGWPMVCKCELQKLKTLPIKSVTRGATVYLGIAKDEPKRFGSLSDTRKSPLVEIGWTENDCMRWCKENNLLSPSYAKSNRGGVGFVQDKQYSSSGHYVMIIQSCGA